MVVFQYFQGFFPAGRQFRFASVVFQESADYGSAFRTIVNYQNPQFFDIMRHNLFFLDIFGLSWQMEFDEEDSAFAIFASHQNLSIHQIHQLFADRQAQPGSPVFSHDGRICLDKAFEESLKFFRIHSRTIVFNEKLQSHAIRGFLKTVSYHGYTPSSEQSSSRGRLTKRSLNEGM